MFGYTNARGICFHAEEFATFQDEWLNYAFFNRDWDPVKSVAYDVTPSRSMLDCLMWYYRKLFTCFEGVYWDNLYLAARHDPVVSDGTWTDGKGRVHPGLGLFAMRELVKRTAVLLHEEGLKLPSSRVPLIMMGHMTNTMIVPVLSFINCTYDWEWKYGLDDFQDRFTPELTVAETIGRQVGAWPTILAGGHWNKAKAEEVARARRTRLAVCLVHEIAVPGWKRTSDVDFYAKLFAFGYGSPECEVYNYWQDGHPVTVTGETAMGKTLVISKPGATLVAVTDYGEGGPWRVRLDLEKLRLDSRVAATNFETGEAIKRVGPGEFEIDIPKHDLRAMVVK